MRLAMIAGVALLATPVAARAQTAQEALLVAAAQARGQLMFAYDRAAWIGTDAFLKQVKGPASRVAGYIVDGPASSPRLTFYDKDADNPQAVYVALFQGGKLVKDRLLGDGEDRTLDTTQRRMIDARGRAIAHVVSEGVKPCAPKSFNSVVIPPTTADAPIDVYLLTPQTTVENIPFGGHYRVTVAPDGNTSSRAFTKSCIELPRTPPADPQGREPVGAFFNHVMDPIPTELHVFSSLYMQTPLMIATHQPAVRVWPIVQGRIRPPANGSRN